MQSAASRTNHSVASPAATTEKQQPVDRVSISQRFARLAATKQRFHSNLRPTDLCIAATVLQGHGSNFRGGCVNQYVADNKRYDYF